MFFLLIIKFSNGNYFMDTSSFKKLNFIIESGLGKNTYVEYIKRRTTGFYSDYDVINFASKHFLIGIRYNLDKKRRYSLNIEMGIFKGKFKHQVQVSEIFYLNDTTLVNNNKKIIYTYSDLIPFFNLSMNYCFKNNLEIGIKGTLYSIGHSKNETLIFGEKYLYKLKGQNIYLESIIDEENSNDVKIYNNLFEFNAYNMHNFSLYVNKRFKFLRNKYIGFGINYLIPYYQSFFNLYNNMSININFQI